ncbi:hypothetical protein DBB29_00765 [Pandoraea cepalis]|uniref:Chromosome partition protein Smc n=1 Tax=Pandoraea cepalis TaxID=2508294 RepID=A0AAW7MH29_9BURK|nr:hypothetical protein [Pandoraea cepalis]MDN4576665.1 hypothetical protein [Pandoraea cepalis]
MARRILARLFGASRFIPSFQQDRCETLRTEAQSQTHKLSGEIVRVDRDLTVVDARIISASDRLASQRREMAEWENKVDQAFAINRVDLASAASIRANAASLRIAQLEAELDELVPRAHGLRDKRKVLDKQRKQARSEAGMATEHPSSIVTAPYVRGERR